ncbi:MAG: T9SS type A sorting domain-containing protein [Rhodothermales bacterium]
MESNRIIARVALTVTVFLVVSTLTARAQISHGGTPYTWVNKVTGNVDQQVMAPVSNLAELANDSVEVQQKAAAGHPYVPRFGKALSVDLGLNNSGTWTELPNGDRLWRLRIKSPGAISINLIFDHFFMPDGSTLFIYDQRHHHVIGAFNSENNKSYGRFSTMPIPGGDITLEYYEPASASGLGSLHLARVIHAYRNVPGIGSNELGKTFGFGDSDGDCEVDITCPSGSSWQTEGHAVAMILLSGGTRWCSGTLMNNASQDWTPYFLTAFHCGDTNEDADMSSTEKDAAEDWLFMFDYQSPYCSGTDGDTYKTVSGSTYRAGYYYTDFMLVEMSSLPPEWYHPQYAGWSKSSSAATSVAGIHHPRGDVKKISLDNSSVTLDSWPGNNYDHGTDNHWRVNDWDTGATEGGSSGSPLFDQNKRVVGQLTGGRRFFVCDSPRQAWYGVFHKSWEPNANYDKQLRHWLDPSNSHSTLNTIQGFPEPPSNLVINNPNEDWEFLELSWTASSTSGATYKIERCQTTSQYGACYPYFSQIGTSSTTTYTDTDVMIEVPPPQGEPYQRYRVRSVKSGINSLTYSNEAQIIATSLYKRAGKPTAYELSANYPNPFNPTTEISFSLPEDALVVIRLMDVTGREVSRVVDAAFHAGRHTVTFDASGLPSGVYLYRMEAGSFTETRRMILMK